MSEQPEVLWRPSAERVDGSRLSAFATELNLPHDSYGQLWEWSVEHLEEFWAAAWQHFDVIASRPYDEVLSSRSMPGARWFTGARLNLAENVLREEHTGTAIVAVDETDGVVELSWDELRGQVGALQATLRGLGVVEGDRVGAYLPNGPEAIIAMLACAAQGAIWSTCAPDIGPASGCRCSSVSKRG